MQKVSTLAALIRTRTGLKLPAVVVPATTGGEPTVKTWREVAAQAESLAQALVYADLQARESVAIAVANPEIWPDVLFAVWLAGGIPIVLDLESDPETLADRLDLTECRRAFCDADGLQVLQSLRPPPKELVLLGPNDMPERSPVDTAPPDADDPAARPIFCTLARFIESVGDRQAWAKWHVDQRVRDLSGQDVSCYSESRPGPDGERLIVKLTHEGLLAVATDVADLVALAGGDRLHIRLPSHDAASRALEIAVCLAGAAVCSIGKDYNTQPTVVAAPYYQLESLARELGPKPEGKDGFWSSLWRWATKMRRIGDRSNRPGIAGLESLRLAIVVGERLSTYARKSLNMLGISAIELHPLVEVSGIVACARLGREGELGEDPQFLPGLEVEVASNQEVLIRGKALFKGYLKAPAATDRAFLAGWFRTGQKCLDSKSPRPPRQWLAADASAEVQGLVIQVSALDLEAQLRATPEIVDAFALAGSLRETGSLAWEVAVVPDGSLLAAWSEREGAPVSEILTDPRLEDCLRKALSRHNATADFESRVSAFIVIETLPHTTDGRLHRQAATRLVEPLLVERQLPVESLKEDEPQFWW